jgi:hypothetical protein
MREIMGSVGLGKSRRHRQQGSKGQGLAMIHPNKNEKQISKSFA